MLLTRASLHIRGHSAKMSKETVYQMNSRGRMHQASENLKSSHFTLLEGVSVTVRTGFYFTMKLRSIWVAV